ncbi:hypothetical protein HYW76_03035 [Candidatus Pacearchaeota archaeon]|nr:hypothetical protein [Candidatus Pacearchaeota archaeon]
MKVIKFQKTGFLKAEFEVINMIEKERPKWPMQRLKGMYFAMHCWRCKKWESSPEKYKEEFEDNIQKIIDSMKVKEMKFKEFNNIIKNSTFCRFEKRDFSNNCHICKRFGGLRPL